MAYNLKLTIFRISLKKKGGSNKDLYNFESFFDDAYGSLNEKDSFQKFIEEYKNSFDKRFKLNYDKTKGLAANESHRFSFSIESNTIDGEVMGGPTGIPRDLFDQNDTESQTGKINDSEVSALPFYLKIWTPKSHNTGVLIVQSYTNIGVTKLIQSHLTSIFQSHKYNLIYTPFVPEKVVEHFKERSNVYKVAFVKERINEGKRKLLNELFTDFDNLSIRIEVSGFRKSANEFWDYLMKGDKIINSNLEDFDIKENEDFETIAFYEDEEGHKSHTSIKKKFELKPTVFLNDTLKLPNSEFYDFDKIKKHTDEMLLDIKKEIGFLNDSKD